MVRGCNGLVQAEGVAGSHRRMTARRSQAQLPLQCRALRATLFWQHVLLGENRTRCSLVLQVKRMRAWFCAISIALALLCVPRPGGAQRADAQAAARAVALAYVTALNAGDVTGVAALFHDEAHIGAGFCQANACRSKGEFVEWARRSLREGVELRVVSLDGVDDTVTLQAIHAYRSDLQSGIHGVTWTYTMRILGGRIVEVVRVEDGAEVAAYATAVTERAASAQATVTARATQAAVPAGGSVGMTVQDRPDGSGPTDTQQRRQPTPGTWAVAAVLACLGTAAASAVGGFTRRAQDQT